jgi:GT2 family glycosyltransferase
VPGAPTASIVIPTRRRPDYLEVTLGSVLPQARQLRAEVLVVSDGPDAATALVAQRHGVGLVSLARPRGSNAARNRGVRAAAAELIVLIDDDVLAPAGWLEALLTGAGAYPGYEVFGGPIRPRLEGGGLRACGREPAPITTLDLGPEDRDATLVWSANMAIRRSAVERIGPFDEAIAGRGEEEEWERRYTAAGGRIRYLARAGLEHRRSAADARMRPMARAAYRLGRSARRNDVRKGSAPSLGSEMRTLAGCAWHTVRRGCANGIVMGAHTAGRLREALAERQR